MQTRLVRGRGRPGALLTLAVAALLAGAVPAQSAPSDAPTDPPSDAPRLSPGPWRGTAYAGGVATGQPSGVDFSWDGDISAGLSFVVSDGADPTVDGTWAFSSNSHFVFDGRGMHAEGQHVDAGSGPISGTPDLLHLDGTTHSTGSVTFTAGGMTRTTPVDHTLTIPTIDVRMTRALCDEAYGDWTYPIEQLFEDNGLSASLGGYWMAFRDTEAATAAARDVLDSLPTGQPPTSDSPLINVAGALLQRVDAFVATFPDWDLDEVLDIATQAESVVRQLRNLGPCEQRLFGADNVEQFVNGLTSAIQNLIILGLEGKEIPVDAFENLTNVALRSGAIGAGAPDAAVAARAEQALKAAGERILAQHLDSDGSLRRNDATRRVMITGMIMDWTYDVGGGSFPARETFGQAGQSWQPDGGSSGDGGSGEAGQ